jgi:uncharacterized protein (DUF1778 family)
MPTEGDAQRSTRVPPKRPKQERIEVRVDAQAHRLLVMAARRSHLSSSDYVRSTVLRQAETDLAEFVERIDADQWDRINALPEAPARELPELDKLMAEPRRFRSVDED